MATGVKACESLRPCFDSQKPSKMTHLEHLDVGHRKVQVCRVAENEGGAEEKADGEDAPEEHVLGHVHVLRAIDEVRCSLQNTGANRL